MNRKLVVSLLCLILLTALFFKVRNSLPVLRAQGVNLSYENFKKNKEGLVRFRDLNRENASDLDIEKGILLSLIEDAFIKNELKKAGSSSETEDKIVNGTISERDSVKLEKSIGDLYGWTVEDFKNFVLYPQARRILWMEELQKEKRDPQKWLEKSMSEANISIYLLRWKWSDNELKRRF
ncbi:hypothetical protein HYT00_00700 [Candidatus Giovannonibacteria bacterium]|nr:hypothetical protein [Candidatus Giovannonibacteria bacterium]